MVKSYDRYEQQNTFGVIASLSNIVWIPKDGNSLSKLRGLAISSALEEILIWDIKTGETLHRLRDGVTPGASNASSHVAPSPVSFIAHHSTTNIVAAGHNDGSIKIWDLTSRLVLMSFTGHKSAVTCLKFDLSGTRLVSGSADSSIIMWDLVGEEGLFSLKGHKGPITGLQLLKGIRSEFPLVDMDDYLLSVSKDGLVKLWELKSVQCVETHMAHSNECWALGVNDLEDMVLTSGNRDQIKAWTIDLSRPDTKKLVQQGTFEKQSKSRCADICFYSLKKGPEQTQVFYLQNADRTIEVWRVRGQEEIKKGVIRRTKRLREKGCQDDEIESQLADAAVSILFIPLSTVRMSAKVRACSWVQEDERALDLLVALANNSICVESIAVPESIKKAHQTEVHSVTQSQIELPGHRTDIRAMDLLSDNKLLATASNGELKIWNVRTCNVIRTLELSGGYALCCKFLPGGSLVVVGFKNGDLELYDLTTSSLVDRVERAHESEKEDGLAIWSLDLTQDGTTLITGGNDQRVKFWKFEVHKELVPGTRTLISKMRFVHSQTLELGQDVLCVRILPDARLLAISLLNNNVQVVFLDTMKLFLTLYGHKLPVLSIDISTDAKLIITSSADKNIKIWGLDFGDCHKSIFGHQDSIMNVRFIPQSHNFFSSGKDGLIKYWDGDKFECIQILPAHQAEVWCIAVSSDGSIMISASHDHLIRIWIASEDQVFLEEEREKEMDQLYEGTLLESLQEEERPIEVNQGITDDQGVSVATGKQTIETLKSGEKLMEALQIGIESVEAQEEYQRRVKDYQVKVTTVFPSQPTRHAILQAFNMDGPEYVMSVIKSIKPSHMDDALLVLPFTYVMRLLTFVQLWTNSENNAYHRMHMPMICKILFFILRNHNKELVMQRQPEIKNQLILVKLQIRDVLNHTSRRVGVNTQGLLFIREQWKLDHELEYFDSKEQSHVSAKVPKRSFVTI